MIVKWLSQLGKLIAGYVVNSVTKEWTLIGQHNPQEPQVKLLLWKLIINSFLQAFYPSASNITISPGDTVVNIILCLVL